MLGISAIKSTFSRFGSAAGRSLRYTVDQIFGSNGGGGYAAGKVNRLTKWWMPTRMNENGVPGAQVQRVRWEAWELWRNNPHARKVVNSLTSKIVGPRGLHPQSHAKRADGTPHTEFRAAAKELWSMLYRGFDYRGQPGQGGLDTPELQKSALRSAVLSGETLYTVRPITSREQARRGIPVPLVLQLIHPERLDETMTSAATDANRIYRGIEIDGDGQRVAYWILPQHPSDPLLTVSGLGSQRIPANQVGHLFCADDIDQLRGVSWFAPALMQLKDTGDYQYNELMASAVSACVALHYTPSHPGATIGLPETSGDDTDLTDSAGNPLTRLQPGMIIRGGSVNMLNPSRPNANAEPWINHLLRGTAASFPGTKASTVTGDYRNSSFSSERSADNDVWPEIEGLQAWFASGFCQPIYEQIIDAAVAYGYFDGIITPSEYAARRREYICTSWQGPVARSINPVDDANAAKLRVAAGISTPQIECSKIGLDWQDVLSGIAEFGEFAESMDIEEEYVNNVLGVTTANVTEPPEVESEDPAMAGTETETDTEEVPEDETNTESQDAPPVAT